MTFLLYDSGKNPIGQYTSDNRGYVYIDDLTESGYYLRELENEGYVPDTELKTVYVKSGRTTGSPGRTSPSRDKSRSSRSPPTTPHHRPARRDATGGLSLRFTTGQAIWWTPSAPTAGALRFPNSSRCPATPSGRSRPQTTMASMRQSSPPTWSMRARSSALK